LPWSTAISTPTSTRDPFVLKDGRVAAVDFGIMGRIDRQAWLWLADSLWPDHRQLHARRGNPLRSAICPIASQTWPSCDRPARRRRADPRPPGQEISIGRMLEGLFSITRDFDMPTQPHLLLLQKTMVMEEGVRLRSIWTSTCGRRRALPQGLAAHRLGPKFNTPTGLSTRFAR
jgi:hypothetical protein